METNFHLNVTINLGFYVNIWGFILLAHDWQRDVEIFACKSYFFIVIMLAKETLYLLFNWKKFKSHLLFKITSRLPVNSYCNLPLNGNPPYSVARKWQELLSFVMLCPCPGVLTNFTSHAWLCLLQEEAGNPLILLNDIVSVAIYLTGSSSLQSLPQLIGPKCGPLQNRLVWKMI